MRLYEPKGVKREKMKEKNSYSVFLVLWFGQLISSIGSGLTSFGLNIYVFQQTRSAAACSTVMLCAFLPMVLLTPFSGVLADRYSRRILMLIGDFFSAICLCVMLAGIFSGKDNIVMICVCVFCSAIFSSLMDPSYKSTVTDLLTVEQFSKAGGLIQLASSAKFLIAPALAGIIIKLGGIELILMIDICTFFLTLLTVIYAGNLMEERQNLDKSKEFSFFSDLAEGWKSLIKNKGIMVLLTLSTVITFYIGFVETLLTPMLLELTDSATLGVITSVSAIGMLISSIILGIKGIEKKYVNALAISFSLMGILICFVGCITNLYIITAAGFLFFAMIPIANTCIDVLVRSNLEKETQGRVWGLISLISQIGYIVAYGISGPLADYVFNPLFYHDGALAESIGKIVGIGEERGIAFMMVFCGLSMFIFSIIIKSNKSMKKVEEEYLLKKKKITEGNLCLKKSFLEN